MAGGGCHITPLTQLTCYRGNVLVYRGESRGRVVNLHKSPAGGNTGTKAGHLAAPQSQSLRTTHRAHTHTSTLVFSSDVCALSASLLCFFWKVSHFRMIFCSLRSSLPSCCRQMSAGAQIRASDRENGRVHDLTLHWDGHGLSLDGRLGLEAVGATEGVEEAC